jgi:hypothetical protein
MLFIGEATVVLLGALSLLGGDVTGAVWKRIDGAERNEKDG